MKHAYLATLGVATLASAITLTAQTPSTAQAPAQPSAHASHDAITLTGCLKTWDASMGTAPGDSTRSGALMGQPSDPMAKPADPAGARDADAMAATRYVLVAVESATTAPHPSSPAHPKAAQYVVTADAGVNLAAHVNHTIRVTGTVEQARATTTAARPVTPAPGTTEGSDDAWSTLSVTSIAMVAATCTPKS